MTKKEKLASEYVELKKQFDGENFMADIRRHQIWWLVKEFKVIDLEEEIKAVKEAIQQKAEREAREAWFATEEGQAFKAEKEAQMKALWDKQKELIHNAYSYTRNFVQELLGKDFDITFSSNHFSVMLVKEYKNDVPVEFFGHDFEVYFGYDFFDKGFRYEMNYGGLGSFNIGEDVNRTKYLAGLAKFAGSNEVTGTLKEYLLKFDNELRALNREYCEVEKQTKNPFEK